MIAKSSDAHRLDHSSFDGHSRARSLVLVTAIAAVQALGQPSAFGQSSVQASFSSPPSPVGAGARATGIGSAFIGLADDATAASWNPGGLIQLERPEMSVVGLGSLQSTTVGSASETFTENDIESTTTVHGQDDTFGGGALDFLSVALPFTALGRNAVASLNYQRMLSFDRNLGFSFENVAPGAETTGTGTFVRSGSVDAVIPALAIEVVPSVSLGATLNYWSDGLEHPYAWREVERQTIAVTFDDGTVFPLEANSQTTYRSFHGVNGTFGLLWKSDTGFTLGTVLKLPFRARVTRLFRGLDQPPPESGDHVIIELPASYGVGASYRFGDRLTISTDITYVDWGRFRLRDTGGNEFLVTGDPASEYSVSGVWTPRLGAEYLWPLATGTLAGRGGLFFDPEPTRGSPAPFYGGSVGLGVSFPSISIDFAYQLRFGLDANNTSEATELLAVPSVESDTFQHRFYLSIIQSF